MPSKKTKKRMRKVSLGFVRLGADEFPEPEKDYPLVTASSRDVGALPAPDTEFKLLRLQLLSLYIEDLPDFTNRNEALLKLGAHTRTREDVSNKEELSFALEFNVLDRSYAPGFLQRIVFRNVLLREFMEVGLNLVELDKNLADAYSKVAAVIEESGLSQIDAINSIPYLKVATKLFDGLIREFGKNADDLVWSESPALYLQPGPGGAFLRTGIYVLYEARSLHPTRTSKKKQGKPMPLSKLLYRDGEIRHPSDPDWPLSNHMIFSTFLEPFSA